MEVSLSIGYVVNIVSVAWIAFQLVLFSMPAAIPVTVVTMNYAAVVFVGFMFLSGVYYVVYGWRGKFLMYLKFCVTTC